MRPSPCVFHPLGLLVATLGLAAACARVDVQSGSASGDAGDVDGSAGTAGAAGTASSAAGGSDGGQALGGGGNKGTGGSASSGCAVEVTAGAINTCARRVDGSLWCWGENSWGQVGDGTLDGDHCGYGPAQEGSLPGQWCKPSPVMVTALGTQVAQVAVGFMRTCARKNDGSLWCWGFNQHGQLGDGTTTGQPCGPDGQPCKPTPVAVVVLGTEVAELAAGSFHSCARKQDGSLWCWGNNYYGNVGDGTSGYDHYSKPTPVEVATLGNSVAAVAAGAHRTCAVSKDGSLWCWGAVGPEVAKDGGGVATLAPVAAMGNEVAAVSMGMAHTCVIKSESSLWCWGDDYYGQLGDGMTGDPAWPPVPVPLPCP